MTTTNGSTSTSPKISTNQPFAICFFPDPNSLQSAFGKEGTDRKIDGVKAKEREVKIIVVTEECEE